MGDSLEHERTEAIPPEELVESGLRAINEWVRANPAIAEEASRLVESLVKGHGVAPSLVDTVAMGDPTPRGASSTVSDAGAGSAPTASFGDYEIIAKIAQGGMGVVYRARQTKLNRIVALKRIRSAEFADVEQVRRFYSEAEAAAKLDHPGIVPVYDVGEVAGEHFYTMAFVDGESLSDRVKREGPLRPHDAARFAQDAAIAVQVAHDAGIVHRDIKPQNLLLDRAGQVRVTDFGLAKLQQSDSEATREGQVLGTPAYMPPEQALGMHAQVGVRADVYSLGATLYFLLTGRPPFQASSATDTLLQVINNEPIGLRKLDPSIPRDLETICLKTLSKDSARRYPSSQDLADDLGRWLSGEPIRARRVGRMERAWKWCKRKPMIAGLSAAIVIGAILGSIVLWERLNASKAAGLVDALASAEPREVPRILGDLNGLGWWAEPRLRQQLATEGDSLIAQRVRLHARLALAEDDPVLADALFDELLEADLRDVANLRDALSRCSQSQVGRIWKVFRGTVEDAKLTDDQRFRAGLALVGLDASNKDWQPTDHRFLVDQLLVTNPIFQPMVWDLLRPLRKSLADPLEAAFVDTARGDAERLGAASALADLTADDTPRLANLLTYATAKQFEVLYPLVGPGVTPEIIGSLGEIAATLPPDELGSVERIAFGQRRANAAITLLRLGERDRVLPVFDYTDDPEALTQFIFRCRERGVGAEPLLELLDIVTRSISEEPAVDITSEAFRRSARARYALLLSLGEFTFQEMPETHRDPLLEQLADWYANDPSSGVHGAAGWLLRAWGQTETTTRIDQTPVPYSPDREWFTLAIEIKQANAESDLSLLQQQQPTPKTFHYTFIVFPAGEYTIGSVFDEPERITLQGPEQRHQVTLTRPFAILEREVTMEELIAFRPLYVGFMQQHKAQPADAGFGADWYDAVAFSRWLGQQMELPEDQQAYASWDSDPDEYPREPDPLASWAPRDWPVELDRRGFRLPTEAEWEVAARSGVRTAYGYGSDVGLLGRFGWFIKNNGERGRPPRELRPSIRGVFDLHGNVFEWTHNWFEHFGTDAVTNPKGPLRGSDRVGRGGNWRYDAAWCRTAYRLTVSPVSRSNSSGFRLALSLSGASSPAVQKELKEVAEPPGAVTERATAE